MRPSRKHTRKHATQNALHLAIGSVLLLLGPTAVVAEQPSRDAQSLCLPTGNPPAEGYQPYTGTVRTRSQLVIGGVPAYQWHHGCGPTAAGMVIGYWDSLDFPALIPGDAGSQTSSVNQAIASTGHYDDYSQPIDDPGTGLLPDASYYGGTHSSNCLGDFMQTSWYTEDNYYGWSWFSDVDNALRNYVYYINDQHGTAYQPGSWNEQWGDFTWNDLVNELNAGRPLVLLVDTDGDTWTDHFVTAVGYRDTYGYQEYACLDTWAPPANIRWERFRGLAQGNDWGIFGATFFNLLDNGITDCNSNGIDDADDIAGPTSEDCNLNDVPDECDIDDGTSADINANGVPDECEPDCNTNEIPDDYDIAQGTSADCNLNTIPDECDIAAGTSTDQNANGIPDECEDAGPPYLLGLGDLPGSSFYSEARGISADGTTIVGASASTYGDQAFRWTSATGLMGLGDLTGGTFASTANAVSADGTVIVGTSDGWASEVAFRWTVDEGLVPLGVLLGGDYRSRAQAVSADGTTIVGMANSANGDEAFHWSADQGLVALGDLPGGQHLSEAQAVSADGSVIAGTGTVGADGQSWGFRWTETDGLFPLLPVDYVGTDNACAASAISADGTVLAGRYSLDEPLLGDLAFRWTAVAGFEWLHTPTTNTASNATATTSDGTLIVGSHSASGAFIWDRTAGLRSLRATLELRYGLDVGGWTLEVASGISANGRKIVGTGTNPSGQTEAWLIELPPPADLDRDGDVDLEDWLLFANCWSDPAGHAPYSVPIDSDPACSICDFNLDSAVNLTDFASFQATFHATG